MACIATEPSSSDGTTKGRCPVTKPSKDARHLMLSARIAPGPALHRAVRRVRRLFDLDCDSDRIAADLGSDPRLGPLMAARPGLRVPGAWDGFETAVRAILGQQVTVRGASTLSARLVASFGRPVRTDVPGLTHLFPRPEDLASGELGAHRDTTRHERARFELWPARWPEAVFAWTTPRPPRTSKPASSRFRGSGRGPRRTSRSGCSANRTRSPSETSACGRRSCREGSRASAKPMSTPKPGIPGAPMRPCTSGALYDHPKTATVKCEDGHARSSGSTRARSWELAFDDNVTAVRSWLSTARRFGPFREEPAPRVPSAQ